MFRMASPCCCCMRAAYRIGSIIAALERLKNGGLFEFLDASLFALAAKFDMCREPTGEDGLEVESSSAISDVDISLCERVNLQRFENILASGCDD